jgi:immunity protein, SdpI family
MTRAYQIAAFLCMVAALAASAAVYSRLPDQIPTHWNIQGQIDGYGSKQWAAYLVPGMLAGMLVLFSVIPWLSPKRFEVDSFRSTYWFIVLVVTAAMAYVHGLILWAGVSGGVDITRALLAGLLIMFGLIGNVLGKVRRNFWVGVRTPWTIASERVWNDTHRLAARLFVAAALVGLLVLLPPIPVSAASVAVFGLIIAAALGPAFYSLWLYKRLEGQGEL